MACNIFSPKSVFDKKTGEKLTYIVPGQDHWDKYYVDRELIYIPVPVEGGAEDEYVLIPKIKETKRSIEEVINSQADDVGLDNMLKKFAMTGDASVLPGPVTATDEVLDLTSLPSDGAEYFQYIHALKESFDQIPIELRKDLSMEEFTKRLISGEIDVASYLASLNKKDGDNNE